MRANDQLLRAAKSIKVELSDRFPGIRFSVRSRTYAGGNHVSVRWASGPEKQEVVSIASKYEEGSFNGLTDSYEPTEDPQRIAFQSLRGSAKYVMLQRRAV